MLQKGVELNSVDLNKGLSVEELDRLIGQRDYRQFLNSRNALFREMDMKTNPPPREDALQSPANPASRHRGRTVGHWYAGRRAS